LAPAVNDIALPYRRLAGFFLPWLDGAPAPLAKAMTAPFHGFPEGVFWDTFCYAGWAPWLAVVLLACLAWSTRRDRRILRPARFVAALGVVGLLLALPPVRAITMYIPATLLRSPARLVYLSEFALAMALGAAVHVLDRLNLPARAAGAIVTI